MVVVTTNATDDDAMMAVAAAVVGHSFQMAMMMIPRTAIMFQKSNYDNYPGIGDVDEFFTSFQKNTSPNINWIED